MYIASQFGVESKGIRTMDAAVSIDEIDIPRQSRQAASLSLCVQAGGTGAS